VWASGHFLLLSTALSYFFARLTFQTISAWWYKGKKFFSVVPLVYIVRVQQVSPVLSSAMLSFASQSFSVSHFYDVSITYPTWRDQEISRCKFHEPPAQRIDLITCYSLPNPTLAMFDVPCSMK
jgi:hypothetical protein